MVAGNEIERGDLARLTAIPGIGKKTSERIVLELKDRLPRAHVAAVAASAEGAPEPSAVRDDLLSALMNLGYHRPLAEKAVDASPGRRRPCPQTAAATLVKR